MARRLRGVEFDRVPTTLAPTEPYAYKSRMNRASLPPASDPGGAPTARLRVVELSGAFGLGGTEQAVEVRAALLPARWFDVRAVGVFGGPRLDRLAASGIATLALDGDLGRLGPLLGEFRPDVLHYTRSERDCVHTKLVQAACRAAGVPVVVETNVFGRPAAWPETRPPDITAHMSLTSMLRCARAAGTSMATLYARGHRAVYLPVPTPEGFGAQPPAREAARAELGIAAGELLACRVARPDLRKWSTRLELALKPLFGRVPELRFGFMAAPADKVPGLVRRFGRRVLPLESAASFERVQTLYAAADILVHSSGIGESFGLAVAEAMLHGLPVVVDSTPEFDNAQVEVVRHEQTGFVVRSSRGFVEATARLARDANLRAKLGRAGQERALAHFADRVIVDEWVRLYARAAKKARLHVASDLANGLEAMQPLIPDSDYPTYADRYAADCARTLGPAPDLRELTLGRVLRGLDTVGYAQTMGAAGVWRVVRSRWRSGRGLGRD
jgi:hypothetical protein